MTPASLALLGLLAAPAPAPSVAPVEWLKDEDGVLEMLLAHRESGRVDGGTLRLDRSKKLLTWTGAPGEIGCPRTLEVAFSDVKRVEEERVEPGFRLELKDGSQKSWTLMPLPHFQFLVKGAAVDQGGMQQKLDDAGLHDAEGNSLRVSGAAAGAGPSVRKRQLPPEVERDVRQAIATLRSALSSGE